uniref:Protein kinase domain-containing protein n=1 Tax=Panagrolaimus sp. JU765 TaxID=591449 RepID=A0AC34R947_9BILA
MFFRLGEGNFGEVHLGSYLTQTGALLQVAVKVLKGKLGKKERVAFVKEASLMRRYQHKHIVRMFGIASQKEPIMILLELAANGSLKGHIHDHPELPVDHLRRYTLEAALGMEFLAANNVIHRDIAARNCLLTKEDSVKISDFGLSSNKGQVTETMLKNVPVKWLAPETLLKGVFNIKTDVYSFGIMMWEIFTKCQKDPYPDINNKEARKNIINGVFNVIPDGIPDDVVAVMKRCWTFNPDDRPSFDHIVRDLGGQAATKSFLSAAVDKNDNYVEEEYFNLPK